MLETDTRRAATNVTLRQLRAFVTVAHLGSFVDASRAMHVTSSALSIVISELESAVGFRVLDRTTRRVRLSSPGEQYLPHAQRILLEFESAQRCALDLRNQKTGIVRIAASQVIAWTLLPPVFAAFRRLRPDVRIDLMDLGVDEIIPALEEARADIGVTLKMHTETLEAIAAFDSRVYVACRPNRWAGRKRVRWAELSGEPLIFTGTDTPARINAALPDGPVLEAAWQVANTGTALALVASGFGSAICAGYVRPMTSIHKLRMIPLVEPTVLRSFGIYASRHNRSVGPAVQAFRSFLTSHFAAAPGGLVEELQTRL